MIDLGCELGKNKDLCSIGRHIAQKEGFRHLNEVQAIHRFLMDKHHWLPSQVRQLSEEDMRILLDGYDNVEIVP